MVTAGSLVVASNADVTITDTSGTIAATVLSGIEFKTGSTVTASWGGITIQGTDSELVAALHTASSKIVPALQ